jgi:pectinesterase
MKVVLVGLLAVTAAVAEGQPRYAAVVDARYTGKAGDTVAGAPAYRSVGEALSGMTANGGARAVIYIRAGRYREKLTIDRPRITLLGESRDSTIITYDAAADTPSPGGGRYGTRGSFTLRIVAPDFRAENLTIENSFDYAANAAKSDSDSTKFRNPQAVALMTDLGSDRATFVNVRILGHQDTLFANSGRHYFYHCYIAGHVDFIFGAGQAVFDECEIVSLDRGSNTNNGYITAASTSKSQRFGFLFLRSRFLKESSAMAKGSVTLGRPWHPFADPNAVASVAFVDNWMDDHIGTKGWDRMSSIDSTGTRVWYEPASARVVEYGSKGPGAVASPSRRVLTAKEARAYTVEAVLDGWAPVVKKP